MNIASFSMEFGLTLFWWGKLNLVNVSCFEISTSVASVVFTNYYFIPWFLFLITQFSFSYPVSFDGDVLHLFCHSVCSSYLSVLFWNYILHDVVVWSKHSTLWWSLDLKLCWPRGIISAGKNTFSSGDL